MRRACDVMQDNIITLGPWDPLEEVEQLFADEEIHGAPVVDADGQLLGVVAASDLITNRAYEESACGLPKLPPESREASLRPEVARDCASDIMTIGVVRVPPDASIVEVARTMRERQVHRVLVMEGETVLGLISSFDLLKTLEEMLDVS